MHKKNAKSRSIFISHFEPIADEMTHFTMHKFSRMAVKLVTLILLNVFVSENASLQGCPKSKIACLCGERPNEIKFFETQAELFYKEPKDCQQLSSEVCASHSCFSGPSDALNPVVDVAKHAIRENLFHQVKHSFNPLDDNPTEYHQMLRDRRSASKCFPPQVDHAKMDCYLWAEFVSCDIRCSRGFAFVEDGKMMVKTKRVCRESKPVWSPKNTFPLCKPYINCKAILVKPGKLTCYPDPELPYCDISCKMDLENGYGELIMERFECTDEHFAEKLPHCAVIDKTEEMLKTSENRQTTAPEAD